MALGLELSERVEVFDVGGGVGQRHALVLRGDVAKIDAEVGELRGGAQPSVDVRAAPALLPPRPFGRASGLNDPPDDELPLGGQPRGQELRGDARTGRKLEERLDLGLVGTTAHQLRARARAEDEGERVDQHRLSRARLAGHHVETGRKVELETLDQYDISDT